MCTEGYSFAHFTSFFLSFFKNENWYRCLLSKQQHVKGKLDLGSWDFRPAYGLIENHSDVAAGKVICEMGSAQVPIAPCTGPGCVLLKVCGGNWPLIVKERKCKHEVKKEMQAHSIPLAQGMSVWEWVECVFTCISCACMHWPVWLFAQIALYEGVDGLCACLGVQCMHALVCIHLRQQCIDVPGIFWLMFTLNSFTWTKRRLQYYIFKTVSNK